MKISKGELKRLQEPTEEMLDRATEALLKVFGEYYDGPCAELAKP